VVPQRRWANANVPRPLRLLIPLAWMVGTALRAFAHATVRTIMIWTSKSLYSALVKSSRQRA
jgi:hypothetical protein